MSTSRWWHKGLAWCLGPSVAVETPREPIQTSQDTKPTSAPVCPRKEGFFLSLPAPSSLPTCRSYWLLQPPLSFLSALPGKQLIWAQRKQGLLTAPQDCKLGCSPKSGGVLIHRRVLGQERVGSRVWNTSIREPSLQIFKGLPKQVALLSPKSSEGQLRACIQPGLGEGEEAFVYMTPLQDRSGLPGL